MTSGTTGVGLAGSFAVLMPAAALVVPTRTNGQGAVESRRAVWEADTEEWE